MYTDLGLFTCDPRITSEMIEIFNYLTGLSLKRNYRKFLISPVNMRQRFMEMIEKEIENAREGKPAGIIAKMNSMEDQEICEALYRASSAGVPIELIVRGFCCLRPGVEGLSQNIRVRSIVGRFLEHSRIYYFRSGAKNEADGKMFIGSAPSRTSSICCISSWRYLMTPVSPAPSFSSSRLAMGPWLLQQR